MDRLLALTCALVCLCACEERRTTIIAPKGKLELDTLSIAFGDVVLGDRKTATIRATNNGGRELNLCLPRLSVDRCPVPSHLDPADQRFDWPLRDMRWVLRTAETLPFSVAFEPDRPGAFASTLVIGHDGENGPEMTIALSGNGVTPNVSFSADAFDFGPTALGASATQTLVVQNLTMPQSTVVLSISTQTSTVFGARAGNTDLIQQRMVSVPPGQAFEIELSFSPAEERAFQQQLTIDYCPGCSQVIRMNGLGVAPRIQVAPAELSFPTHEDREPESADLEIRSTGTGPLTVLGFEVRDGPADEFRVNAGTLPLVLAPGTSAMVEVEHLGRVPGIDVASLVVLSDAWRQPQTTLSLLAESTGPNIDVVPRALGFGAVRPGATSERTVVVQNTGNRPLTVTGIQISPAGDLRVTPPALPVLLAAGERIIVPVSFAPLAEGAYEATLLVASDDADEGTLLVPVTGTGGDPVGCSFSAAPPAMELGLRERGVTTMHRVQIRNVGPERCTLSNPVIRGYAGFALAAGTPAQLTVDPGAMVGIPFELTATAYGQFQAALELMTDDPTQPVANVPLLAQSEATAVRLAPRALDFGPVNPNCRSRSRSVWVHTYALNAVVDTISLDPSSSAEFELGAINLPANVLANQSFQIPLSYRPTGEGEDFGILHVTVNGRTSAVPLYGRGVAATQREQRFTQSLVARSDVVFVVNNTNSTVQERQRLAQAIPAFFSYAQAEGIDFRVANMSMEATFGDRGAFLAEAPQQEKVITPQSVDPAGAFSSNVSEGGGGNTAGTQAAFLALSDPLLNVQNAGFLRPDGLLTLIFVTDEDDESQGDLAAYERHFALLKGARGGRFQALAIVHNVSGTCNNTFGNGVFAPSYLGLVERTGGISRSICADWSASVTALAPYAFGRTRRFTIDAAPVSTSIEVRVDDNPVPRTDPQGNLQWTYSDQSGAVLFSEAAAPSFGAEVKVTYALECL